VIYGGDLNMRDTELAAVGGLPPGLRDAWEFCGRRKELEFTWDLTR
jgi:tyrosyl-DNA phosphodiesterase 2